MREALEREAALAGSLVEPPAPALLAPAVTPPLTSEQAAGLDLILEGFLLHHGTPRHLALGDEGRRVLAGDYCYAQGLVRVADAGDLHLIELLSDLVALSAAAVAEDRRDALAPLWHTTVAAIAGAGHPFDERLAAAKVALRGRSDPGPLNALAATLPPAPELRAVFDA